MLNTIPTELLEALNRTNLSDPGVSLHYPRSNPKDLTHKGFQHTVCFHVLLVLVFLFILLLLSLFPLPLLLCRLRIVPSSSVRLNVQSRSP